MLQVWVIERDVFGDSFRHTDYCKGESYLQFACDETHTTKGAQCSPTRAPGMLEDLSGEWKDCRDGYRF